MTPWKLSQFCITFAEQVPITSMHHPLSYPLRSLKKLGLLKIYIKLLSVPLLNIISVEIVAEYNPSPARTNHTQSYFHYFNKFSCNKINYVHG